MAKRRRPTFVTPPNEADEEEVTSSLVGRPAVVPMRSSTPVTALEKHEGFFGFVRNGAGLGLARGQLAHQAIQRWFTSGRRPCLKEMARQLDDGLSEENVDPAVRRGGRNAGLARWQHLWRKPCVRKTPRHILKCPSPGIGTACRCTGP